MCGKSQNLSEVYAFYILSTRMLTDINLKSAKLLHTRTGSDGVPTIPLSRQTEKIDEIMDEHQIKTTYRTCPRHEFDSVAELDKFILDICNDLAVKSHIRVSIMTAKHTRTGLAKVLVEHFGEGHIEEIENAPIYMGWAFKSQPFEEISKGIKENVAKGAKLIILDRCADDVTRYAELAAELNVSMIALDIKNNN